MWKLTLDYDIITHWTLSSIKKIKTQKKNSDPTNPTISLALKK